MSIIADHTVWNLYPSYRDEPLRALILSFLSFNPHIYVRQSAKLFRLCQHLHSRRDFADFMCRTYQRVDDQIDGDQVDDFADVALMRVKHPGADSHDHADRPVNIIDPTADWLVVRRYNYG